MAVRAFCEEQRRKKSAYYFTTPVILPPENSITGAHDQLIQVWSLWVTSSAGESWKSFTEFCLDYSCCESDSCILLSKAAFFGFTQHIIEFKIMVNWFYLGAYFFMQAASATCWKTVLLICWSWSMRTWIFCLQFHLYYNTSS